MAVHAWYFAARIYIYVQVFVFGSLSLYLGSVYVCGGIFGAVSSHGTDSEAR